MVIYISPNVPIDERGTVGLQGTAVSGAPLLVDADSNAPPRYEDHGLDELYAGVQTPLTHSAMSTPFYGRSRAGSYENLPASLAGMADTEVQPDDLRGALQRLNAYDPPQRSNTFGSSSTATPLHHGHGSTSSMQDFARSSGPTSAPRSNHISRRTSEEENGGPSHSGVDSGRQTPQVQHVDFSGYDLAKLPSYGTARQIVPREQSADEIRALPNYQTAVSTPPSPIRRPASPARTIQTLDSSTPRRSESNSDVCEMRTLTLCVNGTDSLL